MDYFSRIIVVVCVLMMPVATFAGNVCYQWRGNSALPWSNTPEDAAAKLATYGQTNQSAGVALTAPANANCGSGGFCEFTGAYSSVNGAYPNMKWNMHWKWSCTPPPGGTCSTFLEGNSAGNLTYQVNPIGCPQCPNAGVNRSSILPSSSVGVGTVVCGSDNCEYTVASPARNMIIKGLPGGMGPVATVSSTGQSCSSTEAASTAGTASNSECQSAGSLVGCYDSGTNCGTVNGDRVCVPSMDKGCAAYPSGGVACVVAGGTVNASGTQIPDNGTPGTPATPDAVLKFGDRTINYYSSSTVSTSTNHTTVVEGSTPTGSGGVGSTGNGDDANSNSASGGGDCSAPPSCSGDAILCAITQQEWLARCPGRPSSGELSDAIGTTQAVHHEEFDLSTSLDESLIAGGSGMCPEPPSFQFMGNTVTINFVGTLCQFFGMISPLVIAMGYVSAAGILLGFNTKGSDE